MAKMALINKILEDLRKNFIGGLAGMALFTVSLAFELKPFPEFSFATGGTAMTYALGYIVGAYVQKAITKK